MIFRFSKKRFSDVVKVVEFLEKEKIEYEVTADIELSIAGEAPVAAPVELPDPADVVWDEARENPGWAAKAHDGKVCKDIKCTHPAHYFDEVV